MTPSPTNRSELDPYRLPRHVRPLRYEIRLEPNLDAATFAGRVVIEADVSESTRLIALNAKDLRIDTVFVDGNPAVHALGLQKRLEPVRGCRKVTKADMRHNSATPVIDVDTETYAVRADGELLVCEPAHVLPMAQRYFLF